jgi:hypothetical protein
MQLLTEAQPKKLALSLQERRSAADDSIHRLLKTLRTPAAYQLTTLFLPASHNEEKWTHPSILVENTKVDTLI